MHWGEISPFEVWYQANNKMYGENKKVFLSEIGWREFSYHLLYNFPNLQEENLKITLIVFLGKKTIFY